MQEFVRSVAGAALQTAQLLGKPVVIQANSSLNQKFDIQASTQVSSDDRLAMKYATIGNGGVRVVTGVNGVAVLKAVQHSPRDAALYSHLPFVLRLPNNDLDAAQRSKYRLRRYETHDGQIYAAYYLKVLDLTATVPQLELRSVVNGVTTSTPYVPTLADLNPTPPAVDDTVLTTTGNYIAATAKVPFTLSTWEIEEFLNVTNIIYGDDGYAMISEIGVCSGVDRAVTGDFNGTTVGYTEAIGVQICTFINTSIPVKFINTAFNMMLDTGSLEPLLELTPATP
jgi:hypothetical protein